MSGTPPQFTLLGPLSVRRDGEPAAIGGQKPRALLTALLLEPNRVVSRDQLIDALWGEAPPDTARNTIQVYVSQLRKLLPDGMLETAPPGYRLIVDPETVDLFRFVRLCEEGRTRLADGDAAGAAEILRSALDLWRGAPLADLAWEPFAHAEISRLDEPFRRRRDDELCSEALRRLAVGRDASEVAVVRDADVIDNESQNCPNLCNDDSWL